MDDLRIGGELVRLAGDSRLTGRAAEHGAASAAANTVRAYAGHLRRFDAWCRERVSDPWQAESASAFLADCVDARRYGAVALRQCAAALRAAYIATGRTPPPEWQPLIRGALKAIVKTHKGRGGAAPLRLDDLKAAARALYRARWRTDQPRARGAIYARDRALLLIGYLAGLRRSELVALNSGDVESSAEGLTIAIRGSKTSSAEIEHAYVLAGRDDRATCPVDAWRDWMESRPAEIYLDTSPQPAWLSSSRGGRLGTARLGGDRSVERIIHRALVLAGITGEHYSAHSLRRGLATELAEHGVGLQQIANAGRWKRLDTVLRYARAARRWSDNPLRGLPY